MARERNGTARGEVRRGRRRAPTAPAGSRHRRRRRPTGSTSRRPAVPPAPARRPDYPAARRRAAAEQVGGPQPLTGGGHPLVGAGQAHAHAPGPGRAVEVPGGDDNAELGEGAHQVEGAHVLRAAQPQVEAGRGGGVVRQPGLGRGRQQRLAAGPVGLPLGGDVLVVGQHGHHDGLDGGRHEEPGVLADLGDGADESRVAGEEGGPVAGEVGLLGQGVQGQEPG